MHPQRKGNDSKTMHACHGRRSPRQPGCLPYNSALHTSSPWRIKIRPWFLSSFFATAGAASLPACRSLATYLTTSARPAIPPTSLSCGTSSAHTSRQKQVGIQESIIRPPPESLPIVCIKRLTMPSRSRQARRPRNPHSWRGCATTHLQTTCRAQAGVSKNAHPVIIMKVAPRSLTPPPHASPPVDINPASRLPPPAFRLLPRASPPPSAWSRAESHGLTCPSSGSGPRL